MFSRLSCWSVLLVSLFALSACGGGGGGGGSTSPAVYTISGTVSGLAGTGLVLQNNGGDDLSISADGSFSFSTQMSDGASYTVTVLTQPSTPAQLCTISNGSGTVATADITDVNVSCVNIYTISGTVSGLVGSGLVLQNNSGDDLSISASGSFSFNTALFNNTSYSVNVHTQPATPWQSCTVTNGSGTVAGADITNIGIVCTTNTYTISGTVSGLKGSGLILQNNSSDDLSIGADGGFFFNAVVDSGTLYTISISTQPSSPTQSCEVSNGSGEITNSNVTNVEVLCSNYWTWVSGSDLVDQNGVYGTKGVADTANVPGARKDSISWRDGSDNLWLFGGNGYNSTGNLGYLNDLWKFDGTSWTWISGSDAISQYSVYGTTGTPDPANMPGGRSRAISWIDSNGTLWLFGGYAYGYYTMADYLPDLWKFDGSNWTCVSGSDLDNGSHLAVFGTKGVAAATNIPGGRGESASWLDSSDNLWLFGGYGYVSTAGRVSLSDLWKFDGTNWTWVSGSNLAAQSGVYGTQGTPDPANAPGARGKPATWIDGSDNLWLFGGGGYDIAGSSGQLNDMWKFDGSNWTWVMGSSTIGQAGVYGTQGTADAANMPGARSSSLSWVDSLGNFWLFGGYGVDSAGNNGNLGDLWKFDGTNWTWVSGSKTVSPSGVYGTQGTPSAANVSGARYGGVPWIDSSDALWLFGGFGYDSSGTQHYLNDLWHYTP